ncbi:hypothetical protein CMV_026877 [Castanea mollissima]|uniref:GST N-terminal domain-containing protein n=1 Tax=Castanea mollissima TaxID=60419 RepID=A0A8J4QJ70_9ROSI|nr:hypothetical protein CMV_026877 [Castanea mollissima]
MNFSKYVRLSNSQTYRFPRSQLGILILSHDIENLSEIGAKRFSVKPWLWRVSILFFSRKIHTRHSSLRNTPLFPRVVETPNGPLFESNAIARYVTRLKP